MTEANDGNRMATTCVMQANLGEATRCRAGELSFRQPVLNWPAKEKYRELRHT